MWDHQVSPIRLLHFSETRKNSPASCLTFVLRLGPRPGALDLRGRGTGVDGKPECLRRAAVCLRLLPSVPLRGMAD